MLDPSSIDPDARCYVVLGAAGMLGTELRLLLEGRAEVYSVARPGKRPPGIGLDLAFEPESLESSVATLGEALRSIPNLAGVINAIAYTAVDKAESEPNVAFAVNRDLPLALAQLCEQKNVPFVHVSTDFVFDGTKGSPYQPDDDINPLSVYGQSKAGGEPLKAITIRTSWLYSDTVVHGTAMDCFPMKVAKWFDGGRALRIVADQLGTPTHAYCLAQAIGQCLERGVPNGTYHFAGLELMSWHEVAVRAVKEFSERGKRMSLTEITRAIEAISTEAYPTPAKRPKFSALDSTKLISLGVDPHPVHTPTLVKFNRSIS